MKSVRSVLLAVFLGLFVAVGIQLAPATVGAASAAPNCATLAARISALNADARNYNAQVQAINARGGGTAAQVSYYNAWKARGEAQQNALRGELAQCQSQGKLRNQAPPRGPGATQPPAGHTAPRSTPPRANNPTPGYPRPQKYPARSNVVSDRELKDGSRVVRFRDGGSVTYRPLIGGRSTGSSAILSRGMRGTGTPSVGGVVPPGFGRPYVIRGHVIANRLGGLGGDARNIVALTRSANARMASVENRVYKALGNCRSTIRYTVSPVYLGPTQPGGVIITAYGCGLSIDEYIPN